MAENDHKIRPIDPSLGTLAELADKAGMGIGVTLNTHGVLVSGSMISNVKFFEKAAQEIKTSTATADDPEIAELALNLMVQVFDKFTDDVKQKNQADSEVDDVTTLGPTEFIHLENVQFIVPGNPPLITPIWRGRISEISGFTIGMMRV